MLCLAFCDLLYVLLRLTTNSHFIWQSGNEGKAPSHKKFKEAKAPVFDGLKSQKLISLTFFWPNKYPYSVFFENLSWHRHGCFPITVLRCTIRDAIAIKSSLLFSIFLFGLPSIFSNINKTSLYNNLVGRLYVFNLNCF